MLRASYREVLLIECTVYGDTTAQISTSTRYKKQVSVQQNGDEGETPEQLEMGNKLMPYKEIKSQQRFSY